MNPLGIMRCQHAQRLREQQPSVRRRLLRTALVKAVLKAAAQSGVAIQPRTVALAVRVCGVPGATAQRKGGAKGRQGGERGKQGKQGGRGKRDKRLQSGQWGGQRLHFRCGSHNKGSQTINIMCTAL